MRSQVMGNDLGYVNSMQKWRGLSSNDADFYSTKYRLKAVCKTKSSYNYDPFPLPKSPHESTSGEQEYPLELLNILKLTIFTVESGSRIDRGGFLEIYQPLGR